MVPRFGDFLFSLDVTQPADSLWRNIQEEKNCKPRDHSLAQPCTWTSYSKGTFDLMSTGGFSQPEWSPCSQTAQARPRTHADTSAPMIRRLCYVLAQGDPSGCCPDFFWHQIENWFLESWHTVLSQFIKTQPLSEQNLMNNLMNHPNMPIKGSPNLSNWNRAWWVN